MTACVSRNSAKFLEGVTTSILKRIPALRGIRVVRQWSGAYDNTPDHNAIIDWTPVEGLLVNCGWSGHGLQFGPSGGRVCKELLMGEAPFVDLHRFPFKLRKTTSSSNLRCLINSLSKRGA
ncbi:MAG: NAD(P)/FAD-dependent oxidoreductase [Cloacibacillus evryensis]